MSIEKSLAGLIATVEQDRSLRELRNLLQRGEAFDDLDACPAVYQVNGTALQQRAKSISAELESINSRLCQSIRREIQLGAGKEILLEWMPEWNDPSNFTNRKRLRLPGMTLTPRLARFSAVLRPSPRLPPVMIATEAKSKGLLMANETVHP